MSLKIAAWVGLAIYSGFAIGKPEAYMPSALEGKIGLIVLAVLWLCVPVRVAYRLRGEINELKKQALPEEDRRLILELRRTTGRAFACYKSLFPRVPIDEKDVESIRDISGQLQHYPGIYRTASTMATILWFPIGHLPAEDVEKLFERAEGDFRKFLQECEAILTRPVDPEASKAS